jgi:hypothetical protein
MGMNAYAPADLEVLTVMSRFRNVEAIHAVTTPSVSKFLDHLNANVRMVGQGNSAR